MKRRTPTFGVAFLFASGCSTVDAPDATTESSDSAGDSGNTFVLTTADSSPSAPGDGTSEGSSSDTSSLSQFTPGDAGSDTSGTAQTTSGFETGSDSSSTSLGSTSDGSTTSGVAIDLPGPECSTYDDQCPEGEKCNAFDSGGFSWSALGCFPLDPAAAAIGEPCTAEGISGVDSCAQGAICWGVDDAGQGTCVAYCEGTPEAPTCADGGPCSIINDGVLNLCLPGCDPLLQDCGKDEVCIAIVDAFGCAPDASDAEGQQGDECMFLNACDPGLLCLDGLVLPDCAGACCSSLCNLEDPEASTLCSELAAGTACVPFFLGEAPPGLEDVGICILP